MRDFGPASAIAGSLKFNTSDEISTAHLGRWVAHGVGVRRRTSGSFPWTFSPRKFPCLSSLKRKKFAINIDVGLWLEIGFANVRAGNRTPGMPFRLNEGPP